MILEKDLIFLLALIGFAIIGTCYKPLNAYLKKHRKENGIIDLLYSVLLFSSLCNVLEVYMNWLLAGSISIALTGLVLYIIYSDHKTKRTKQTTSEKGLD